MTEKKILSTDELMVDYAEMTSLNFAGEEFCKVRDIQKMTGTVYDVHPSSLKYGNFDIVDMLQSVFRKKSKSMS
jgi:hypothetical protein